MNLKEGDKIQFEECVSRIRFKPLEVDTDAVYKRLRDRIETSRQRIGVSPIWKYTSVAACIALLCVSSFLIWNITESKPKCKVTYYLKFVNTTLDDCFLFSKLIRHFELRKEPAPT